MMSVQLGLPAKAPLSRAIPWNVIATGAARRLAQSTQSIWQEVTAEGVTGWVNRAFLAWLGGTDDVTAQIIDTLGECPSATTMLDLGRMCARGATDDGLCV